MRSLLLCLLLFAPAAAPADRDPLGFDAQYEAAFDRGEYAEAERIATRLFNALPRSLDYGRLEHSGPVRMLAEIRTWQAKYGEAEKLLLPLVEWLNAHRPVKSELRASANWRLAAVYSDTNRYAKADEHFRLAFDALPPSPDKPLDREERMLEDLYDQYVNQWRLWEALQTAQRLLAVRERRHGPNDPSVGVALTSIGVQYGEPYRWAEQAKVFARARSILEPAWQARRPAPLEALENMIYWVDSAYAHREGWKGELCDLRRDLVAEVEKRHGKAGTELIQPLTRYAAYCEDELREAAKEALYKRALEIAQQTRGPHHPVTNQARRDLATFYASRERGKQERFQAMARVLNQQAVEGTRITFGAQSAVLARAQMFDFLEEGTFDCRYSEPACERRLMAYLETIRKEAGAGHPFHALMLHGAAERLGGYVTSGESEADSKARYDLTDRMYRESMGILRAYYGAAHPQHAMKAQKYAEWLRNHNRTMEHAAALLREALPVYRRHFGEADGATLQLWDDHFTTQLRLKRHAETNAEIAAALAALERDRGDYRNVAHLLGWQAGTLTMLGRSDEALRATERRVDVLRRNDDVLEWRRALEELVRAYRGRGMKAEALAAERLAACLLKVRVGEKHNCT